MALRVLLADESTSIKKVMQLALQDFGVEVKAVPLGIDVIPVAKAWNPDIVFVDVLLAKKSGYEVCAEIRADKQLGKLPIVLIWSSFMDIDEKKAGSCGANKRLEKPFDAETLRGLIKELVPTTASNTISSYLSFPNLPDFVEKQVAPPPHLATPSRAKPTLPSFPQAEEPPLNTATDISDIDEPEDFSQVPLPKVNSTTNASFSPGNLDRFKINIPTEDFERFEVKNDDIEAAPISLTGANNQEQEIHLGDLDQMLPPNAAHPNSHSTNSGNFQGTGIDPVMAEQVVREHVRSVLQDIAWKIIPDMTERIVREEIHKLLKDAEKL